MELIYTDRPRQRYKRNSDVGGDAAQGNAACSWVSIKRVPFQPFGNQRSQEIVCLFHGHNNQHRSNFLNDLRAMRDSQHIFGRA